MQHFSHRQDRSPQDQSRQDQSRHDSSPLPIAKKPGPTLPRAGGDEISLGGFIFSAGDPPEAAGVFALTRRIGEFLYPVLIGEAENMAAALEKLHIDDPVLADGLADGICWMARDTPRMRSHILRDLVGKYDPPLNVAFRKGRAAPEIAALAPDRGQDLDAGEAELGAATIEVSEAELHAMVRGFYDEALRDPLIGPVFKRSIADWDQHFEAAQDFWSRSLLGTTRYSGSPFTPHLSLNLKPEFFERWIALFKTAAETHLPSPAARAAIAKVEHMSVCFQAGLFPPKPPASETKP